MPTKFGRYRDRSLTALLREVGWSETVKQVERTWRWEGLMDPQKQPKRSRLWLNNGWCIPPRPESPNL